MQLKIKLDYVVRSDERANPKAWTRDDALITDTLVRMAINAVHAKGIKDPILARQVGRLSAAFTRAVNASAAEATLTGDQLKLLETLLKDWAGSDNGILGEVAILYDTLVEEVERARSEFDQARLNGSSAKTEK